MTTAEFDEFAVDYDRHLRKGLALTGESKEHFARERIRWTKGRLREWGHDVESALDYGCGTGTSTPLLQEMLGAQRVTGVDVSQRSIDLAPSANGLRYSLVDDYEPASDVDLAFTNGVFHHIPAPERVASVDYLRRSLRPHGVLALWENSPYNPATHYGMRMNEFDRDCKMLRPVTVRALLMDAGFSILRSDFLFVFPHLLRGMRWIEPRITHWPVGGQYVVLAQRID